MSLIVESISQKKGGVASRQPVRTQVWRDGEHLERQGGGRPKHWPGGSGNRVARREPDQTQAWRD